MVRAQLGPDLSLVEAGAGETREVFWVNWQKGMAGSIGQRVNLDAQHRVIYSPTANHPWTALQSATIVHPTAGVTMMRVTARFRLEMPLVRRILKPMWETSVGGEVIAMQPCELCGLRSTTEAKACPLCLCSWHPECAEKIIAVAVDCRKWTRWEAEVGVPADFEHFEGKLCPLCEKYSSRA